MTSFTIATKFSKTDVKEMDSFIHAGTFISRSDLIREATRKVFQEQALKEKAQQQYVMKMESEGAFRNPELRVISALFLCRRLSERENIIAKRLMRNPLKPVKRSRGEILLTEMGRDLAEGYLGALLQLRKRAIAHT